MLNKIHSYIQCFPKQANIIQILQKNIYFAMSGHSLMGFVSSPVYILYLKLKVQSYNTNRKTRTYIFCKPLFMITIQIYGNKNMAINDKETNSLIPFHLYRLYFFRNMFLKYKITQTFIFSTLCNNPRLTDYYYYYYYYYYY